MTNHVHFIVMQARLAHTGIMHLHWSFSVDQDEFSPFCTVSPSIYAKVDRTVCAICIKLQGVQRSNHTPFQR